MKTLLAVVLAGALLMPVRSIAQLNDCENAQVVCDNADLEFNPLGPGNNDFADPDNIPGCLTALEQNSAWYYFEIDPNAPPDLVLGFIIHPNGGFGEDYDWALFGPDVNCGDLGAPIRCSSSSALCDFCPETGMGMGALDVTEGPGTGDGFVMTLVVQPGQGFYLLIDNWLGTTNGFVLEWTDSAADYLNCDAMPPCALDAQAGADILACEGDTDFSLDGGSTGNHGNETYLWSGTNGGTAFLDNPANQDPAVTLPPGFTGVIVYTLTVMEDTCVSEDEMQLIVNPLPTVMINPAGPFCPNLPPQVLTGSPAGGVWGGAVTGNTFNPMTNGPGTHEVTYTYTDGNGCASTASINIVVHEGPEVSVDPDPVEFCESEMSVQLTASATGGAGNYVYNWSTPSGMAMGPTFDAVVAGQHIVTVTDMNGCTDSTAVPVTIYLNPEIEINDPGPICGGLGFYTFSATPSGGTFDGEIISPQGDIIPNMIEPGTYTISYSFTDSHDCESTGYLDITIMPVPEAVPTNNGPFCAGGPVQLTGDYVGSGTFYQFLWTGPNGYMSTEQNPTDAVISGEYFFQVIIDDCPSVPVSTTVVVHDLPEAIATNGGPYCSGEVIELFGNTNESGTTIVYTWTGPNGYTSDVQNPTNATTAGTYTLTVSVDGCVSEPVTTLVEFGMAPVANASNGGPYCDGDAIALFGSTMSGGNTITYQWIGPNGYMSSVQNPADATDAGTYQLIIEIDGCRSDTVSTTVLVFPDPQPMITGPQTFCTGFSSVLNAGSGYQGYLWDDGSTMQNREVFDGGTYAVTVTDANGCTGTATYTVTESAALTPTITGTLAFCAGNSTMLDAGTGYTAYLWSNGLTTQTINVTSGGNFGVTVTDASGCTGVAAVNVTANPNPVVMIGGSSTYCIGGSTTLDAGVYASYQWSNDSTTQTLVVTAPGTYTVTVTNANGCLGVGSVNVTESTSLNPVITGGPSFCTNTSITLNAGSGFATYLWSDGSMTQTLQVSVAGTYSVSVSDGQGCTGTASVAISEVMPPVVDVLGDTSVCNTIAGGSVIDLYGLVLSGDPNGTWTDVNNSGASGVFQSLNFNAVAPGTYQFLYTTNSATAPCPEATDMVTITVLDCVCPDVSFQNIAPLCNDGGVVDLTTVVQTTAPGSWMLSQTPPGSNPAVLTGNLFDPTDRDAGDYVLQFSFSNTQPPGCPTEFQVDVHVDASVDAGLETPPIGLCSGTDRLITLADLVVDEDPGGVWTETSGTPSQGNAFNAAVGTFRTAGQSAGTYRFMYTLNGSGSCPDDATEVTIVIRPLPVVVVPDTVVIDCANPLQTIDGSGSSSGAEYVFTWVGLGIVPDGNEQTLQPTVDQPGNYTLIIENTATHCINMATVHVVANTDAPTGAILDVQDPGCFGEQNGIIGIVQVIGGEAPYLYAINNGTLTGTTGYSQLSAGNYTVVIEDINGCRWDTLISLITPQEVSIDLGPDLMLGFGDSAVVSAQVSVPPSEIDSIVWSPAQFITCLTDPCIDVSIQTFGSVNVSATVYDVNGCISTDQLRIDVDRTRRFFIPTAFSPNHDNINDIFYIHGDPRQIVTVHQFVIYDRWGSVVHTASGFSPNDPAYGWDGRYRGQFVNPAVFTYLAEMEFIDGVLRVYTGNVTVVR